MTAKFFIKLEELPDGSIDIKTKAVGSSKSLAVQLGQRIVCDINRRSENAQAAADQIISQFING